MKLNLFNPKQSLNKAYLKEKVSRDNIELFKRNLTTLIGKINEQESEEHLKNVISDFLKDTWYKETHEINTKDRKDLVIHTGKTTKDPVGVILEVKKPGNKSEMMSEAKPNAKAMHELILYYLRERIEHNNIEIKYLVVTNIYEWFIIDGVWFEKNVFRNTKLKKDFESWKLSGNDTRTFYESIAKPFLDSIPETIDCTYFDLKAFESVITDNDKKNDSKLIALYKLLSPAHLLKQPFANDSNSLDTKFYAELLHLIGLEEVKEGSKKLIKRKDKPDPASILENTIMKLEDKDSLRGISNLSSYGADKNEQLYNVALELCITWINRILFLKLLEAQLYKYHKGNADYAFLNHSTIHDFDELSNLFFQVLAERQTNRREHLKEKFKRVPYLNSSLFERTELERQTFDISSLDNRLALKLISNTVLKNESGKKKTGELPTLQYLFDFLDAYDFTSEGSEEIQEQNKNLINASVLGLIFEKINGYKDGSFFTPGFVTMYMCRETIRRAVIQKFNENYKIDCESFDDLKNFVAGRFKAKDILEFNTLINNLKICDPAVGSGHFLVSALNEVIAIKAELGILADNDGLRLTGYDVKIENDELIVTYNDDTEIFEYTVTSNSIARETQRVQKTLFHEKELIIENCLFGVDINPNSVKICRLRLWIELLKNAYYTEESKFTELETLPNIDINIKCGNSLISRFPLDSDLKKALKGRFTIDTYKIAVHSYHEAENKEEKRKLEELIDTIKKDFRTEISLKSKEMVELLKTRNELHVLTTQTSLFDMTPKEKKSFNEAVEKLTEKIKRQETVVEEIRNNKVYENAFEWRFEFPEVLNNEGNYVGFDVVIGNPPYGVKFADSEKQFFKENFSDVHIRTPESYNYFVKRFVDISNRRGLCNLIIPSSFLNQAEFEKTREVILNKHSPFLILNLGDEVFPDVATPTCIIGVFKEQIALNTIYNDLTGVNRTTLAEAIYKPHVTIPSNTFLANQSYSFIYKPHANLIQKCYKDSQTLKDVAEEVATGVSSGLDKAYVYLPGEIEAKNLEKVLLKKLVIGGEINKYFINPKSNKKIIYITDEVNLDKFPNTKNELLKYKTELIKRREAANGKIEWFSLNWPRRKKLFEEPKILIRQTANKIMAAYDEAGWYCLKSGIIVQLPKDSKLSYKYMVGLLNSALIDFLYKDLVNEDNRIFPEVKPIQLFKLPIKAPSDKQKNKIEKLVDSIYSKKVLDNTADTSSWEKELDGIVYEIYGLTEKEIPAVDGNRF